MQDHPYTILSSNLMSQQNELQEGYIFFTKVYQKEMFLANHTTYTSFWPD
jgi:hypothetical protein